MHMGWLKIMFLQLSANTELARAAWLREQRQLILWQSKLSSFFFLFLSLSVFWKKYRRPMFSVFLWSCRNTRDPCSLCFYEAVEILVKVWYNSKKLWKHSFVVCVPTAFLVLQNFNLCELLNNYSSSPNGLWVNSPRGQRRNGLLTQRPWGREE